ncbi:MAG: hypothetical protein IJB70_09140 [Clostridia bacterium]|nr:hypothetical protein [Clostridia bacterium]
MKSLVKKITVALILFAMLASNVYASEIIDTLYPHDEAVYTADFTDSEIDANIVVADNIGNQLVGDVETDIFDAYEENGEFVMDCADYTMSTGSYAKISFYATKDHTPYKIPEGKSLVISFDITRYPLGERQFMIGYNGHNGTKARSGPYFKWIKSEAFSGKDGSGDFTVANNGLTLQTDTDTDNWHEMVFVIDSSYVADLFIDGNLMRSGITMRESGSTMLSDFFIYFESYRNRGQVVKLKNFKMYTATESAIGKDHLTLDVTDLTAEAPDANGDYILENNLTLPQTGENGSAITWKSSDEKLIETNGTIHRVSGYAMSDAVTLTATLTNGEETAEKSFTFYVKRKDAPENANMDGDYIIYDDFSNSNLLYSDPGSNGKYYFENEKLVVENTSGKEWTQYLTFNKNKSTLPSGKYVLEYDLTKSQKAMRSRYDIIGQFYGTDLTSTRMFVRHEILSENRDKGILTQAINTTDTNAKQISNVPVLYTTDTVKVKYILDDTNNLYTLYIDGALLAKDAPFVKISSGYEQTLAGLRFTLFGNGHKLTVDNLKLYKLADGVSSASEASVKTIELGGENVTKLENGGAYVAKLNVTDFTSALSDGTNFVVALYNKATNELESVQFIDAKILQATAGVNTEAPTVENYGYYAKTTVEVPEDYENYYIKLMHWNEVTPVSVSKAIN